MVARIYVGDVLPAHAARIEGEAGVIALAGIDHRVLVVGLARGPRIPDQWRSGFAEVRSGSGPLGMVRVVRQWVRALEPEIVHTHGIWATLISGVSLRLIRVRPVLVYEVHGALAYESIERHGGLGGRLRFLLLYLLENVAVLMADRLLLVSEEIKRYYPAMRRTQGVAIARAVEADVGTTADALSEELEEVLRFAARSRSAGRRMVVYSGGLGSWQCMEETIALLARCDSVGIATLVLTFDLDGLVPMLPVSLVESEWFKAVSLTRSDVPSALAVCDVGIVLREDSVVNRVASPTKAFEYLAAGLHIVTTTGAVGLAKLVDEHGAGLVVALERASEVAPPWIASADRSSEEIARVRALVHEHFTWRALGADLLSLYG
jgi:glycosyltransferase involved in cell wall biosynthesis